MPASTPIAGHTDSVLCCTVLPSLKLLASGGEDGAICLTDLASLKPAGRVLAQPLGDAVPALCCLPGTESTLFAAAGPAVLQLDLRRLSSSGSGSAAVVQAWEAGQDEVNGVAATAANGGWLAAGDDAGEVQVISLAQPAAAAEAPRPAVGTGAAAAAGAGGAGQGGRAAQAAEAEAPPLPRAQRPASYKTLRRGHTNICSAVAFRPHRPWELLSGGLDCSVVQWDFSRLRALHVWGMSGEATASGGQLLNPPMVHSVAVPQTDDRSLCRLMAVGRGDGCISLYDADGGRQPGSSSAAGSGGGGKKGGKGRGKGRAGSDSQRQAAAAAAPPGRLALLGTEQGGHTAAVNCVAFYQGPGADWRQLLSAGNDCRVLLWNWGAAATAGLEAAEAAAERAAGAEGAGPEAPAGGLEGSGSLRQGGVQAPEGAEEAAAAGGSGGSPPLLAVEHRHGRKINWACSADVAGCPYDVFLADTGRRITALALTP